MKRLSIVIGVLFAVTLASLGIGGVVGAYKIQTGDNVALTQNKVINDTVYLAGRTIDLNSEVYGDVYCAGQSVNIAGTIHGDVMCAGQSVTVTGTVTGDVRLAGQTVTLGAQVAGNATIGAQTFALNSSGSIGGDLTSGATSSTLNGSIGRDLVIGSGSVVVNSTVGRNIKSAAETMELQAGARVAGNIELTSKKDVTKDAQAVVGGKITRTEPAADQQAKSKHGAIFGFSVLWFLYWFAAMLVTAMVLVLLFPRLFHNVTNRALPRPWKALLVGFVASVCVPIATLLLAVSLVGIPLAFIVGLLWFVVLLMSGPFFAYYLGRIMLRKSDKPLLYMLAGGSLLIVLYFVPILGLIAVLAATWIGSGMLLLEAVRRTPKPKYSIPQK